MKLFKYTLVIVFILAYAFIISGCANKPYLHESITVSCKGSPDSWFYENELTYIRIENSDCSITKSESKIMELK